ncbi:efflux transporter outer membrane subunit [Collimonas pratensis]|uniref:efflux transporter outer membrane subunit n=1 Tax=Collimonas pratensis TaxID=279113 RepID=UPI00143DECB4|nr:efflux transporter outer membrane subunit [Collimonas pratensis]NKI70396.1 efflux transporter outer membrane subunit [Collimonas pratensis]
MNFSPPSRNLSGAILAAAVALALAGCAVGPDYVRPTMDVPAHYKESGPWKQAEPKQIDSNHNWWEAYGDATLNTLMQQANQANQNIAQAEAQYRQARAAADAARAGFWPTVGASAGTGRARTNTNGSNLGDSYTVGLQGGWEPDVWGSVRRSVEAGDAGTQASAANLAAARLSIQATLAQDYLQLRVTDLLKDLYARTTAAYARSLKLTQSQYAVGVALRSDVALAESQLKTAEAQAIDLQAQRSQLEHAIAILTGQAPAGFKLAAAPADPQMAAKMQANLPAIPAGLPSDLLERRPDIANAERNVAVANANIGVAKAAYFPALTLSASGGFNSASLAQWFDTPSRVWSLGAALAGTIFDGGLRRAHTAQAVAVYDAAVAQYKQTVLGGFQEVEDNLATLNVLDQESVAQGQAVKASQLAEQLALSQYRAGTATYLTVVTAQTLALSNERTLVQLVGRQLVASVALVKAVGGGWDASQLSQPDNAAQAKNNNTAN